MAWLGILKRRLAPVLVGALIAVLIGGSSPAIGVSSGTRSIFTAIRACKLIDTRPSPYTVGARSTPLAASETLNVTVTGAQGTCNVPATANAVVFELSAYNPTATGGVKVWPQGATAPTNNNLRWVANQAPSQTEVTAKLSSGGQVSVKNGAGTVDIQLDVLGYYQPHDHDDRYYTKAISDQRFFEGSTLILVRADGIPADNGAALKTAISSIVGAAADKPYTVRLAPGIFDVGAGGLDVPAFVHLEGSGEDATIITAPGSPDSNPNTGTFGTVRLVGGASLQDLTVRNTGGVLTSGVGIELVTGEASVRNVTVTVASSTLLANGSIGITANASLSDTILHLEGVTVDVTAGGVAIGALSTQAFRILDVRNSTLNVAGGGTGIGLQSEASMQGGGIHVTATEITVTGGGTGIAATRNSGDDYVLDGLRITVSGGTSSRGIAGTGSNFDPEILDSRIIVSGGSSTNIGVECDTLCTVNLQSSRISVSGTNAAALQLGQGMVGGGTAFVDASKLLATTVIRSVDPGSVAKIGGSELGGTTITSGSGTFACVASYKSDYTVLSSTCT